MAAYVLLIGLAVAGQISSGNDRYSGSGAPRQSGSTNAASGNATGTGLIPVLEPPPADGPAPRNSAAPANSASNPYVPQTGQPAGGDQRPLPFGATNSPPPTTSAPPPFGSYPSQPNLPPNNSTPAQPAVGLKPSSMMRAMLSAPRDSQLSGTPVPLVEVLAGTAMRLEQSQRVEAYWDLCSSVADYYLGLREQEELRRLRTVLPRTGATWQQAEAELAVRIGTSLRAARASQLRLAGWLGRGPASLPLPADMPHCGSYHSRYEEIFAGRPTAEAQELAALLPLRYAELKDASTAVTRAEEWLGAVATARTENSDGVAAVRALELLALRRRAFVQIARDYNRRIARYTELSTPGEIGAERLIGMLIKVENSSTATRPTSSAAPTGRQSNNVSGPPPRTFAEGWEPAGGDRTGNALGDGSVQRASGVTQQAPREERSLLVTPR